MQKIQAFIYVGTIVIVLIVVLIFWGVIPGLRHSSTGSALAFWGTEPDSLFTDILRDFQNENQSTSITYVRKNPATYEQDLVNALASGQGPDLWTIPQTWIARHQNKIAPLPTVLMTEREFNETFAGIAIQAFVQGGKILALPLYVDPLVLYWNKDFFASDAIALPPRTWDEFLENSIKLTKYGASENITRSGAAMGLASNIPEAKDILSLLIIQGGISIVDPATHHSTLSEGTTINGLRVSPAESALRFYTDFARRAKKSYSWNQTFPNPPESFAQENLAMFIGYASHLSEIATANPHLAVGIAPVPQFSGSPVAIGYGRTLGITVSLASPSRLAAWTFAKYITSPTSAARIADGLSIAPARRDLLSRGSDQPARSVMYESAIRARAWYDPNEMETAAIFQTMIESTLRGTGIETAAQDASNHMQKLLK